MTEAAIKPKLKMIWSTNAPWTSSGYAVQFRELAQRFVRDGYDTACSCFYGLEGGIINYSNIMCYPKMGQLYGGDALYWHQQDYGAHVAFTFQDVWPIDPQPFLKCKNWIPYVPIDHDPVPPAIVDRLKYAYRIITFSKFGQETLKNAGLLSKLILEGVDTNIFKPLDKLEVRKQIGVPEDVFLFGMVAANKDNPPRKSFQHCMDAFMKFRENHKDIKTGMFFHTLTSQDGGFNIQEYANYLKIAESIWFPPPYHMMFRSPHEVVNSVMNTFDVLLNPSSNEGFGLPIIEAQACGKPVIVNNWSSMPELVVPGVTGEVCDAGYHRWCPIGGYEAQPDVNSLYDKMETVFKYDLEKTAIACREHIMQNYDLDTLYKNEWLPFLAEVEKEVVK